MAGKEKIILSAIGAFFAVLAVWVVVSVLNAPPSKENIACTMDAMLCPDGTSVGREAPSCEFSPCGPTIPRPGTFPPEEEATIIPPPKPIGGVKDGGVLCTMDAKLCPDGSYVSRTGPKCEFAQCSTSTIAPGSCKSDADCEKGYECVDVAPVVREGYQNFQCFEKGAPRPICLSGETSISTPEGDVLIKNIRSGDIVWSVDSSGNTIAVAVEIASHTPAPNDHRVMHLILSDGRELFVSPGHKVADGRTAGALLVGDILGNRVVKSALLVDYKEKYTYDILPLGDTGMYWGNGVLLQSTLK